MGGTIRTHFPTHVLKARPDPSAMTVTAILTWPTRDVAGDFVRPSGLDFAPHAADPWVDLEHGFDPDVGRRPVGWARESLARPGGDYAVSWGTFDVDGTPHRLPVGTTHFDPSDRVSSQVFALVERDALPGVSLEFEPVAGCMKSLGPSPMGYRPELGSADAYRFDRASVVRWTHCARPVNEGALTAVRKSLGGHVPDPLATILSSGRVGGEALDPFIRKALAAYAPKLNRSVVRVEKAVNDDDNETIYDEAAPEAETPETEPDGDEAPATPTVQAHYDVAQGIIDLCEQARQQLESSEHVKGKQYLLKALDKLESVAEDVKANGDKIDGEVSGGKEPEEGDEEPVGDEIETDDEGVMKAIRPVYKANIKRFTLAQVQKAVAADEDAELEKALRRFRRAKKVSG